MNIHNDFLPQDTNKVSPTINLTLHGAHNVNMRNIVTEHLWDSSTVCFNTTNQKRAKNKCYHLKNFNLECK